MGTGVCRLAVFLMMAGILAKGDCQCFQSLACVGSVTVPAQSTLRDCCVNTDDGLSWRSGDGTCTNCIVHGFSSVEYRVNESILALVDEFKLFVKGESLGVSPTLPSLPGSIRSVPVTAKSGSDYRFSQVSTNYLPAEWRLDIEDDDLALEYDDQLNLEYLPRPVYVINRFEAGGQFVRSAVSVFIKDNDRLEINFDEEDYSTTERDVSGLSGISLSLRETQEPFEMELIPATVDVAEMVYDLSHFLSLDGIAEDQKANSGADFNNISFTIIVRAGTTSLHITNITIVDDNVDEKEETFVLVARVLGQAADVACFQIDENSPCKSEGHVGGTRLKIRDDDDMFIGFPERFSFVRENMFPTVSVFPIYRMLRSLRVSEIAYPITISVTNANATVTEAHHLVGEWDVAYGLKDAVSNVLFTTYDLRPGETEITTIRALIQNDIIAERIETFTLRVSPADIGGTRHNFACYDDGEDPVEGSFFCDHTVFIEDDDERLVVSFEHTTYEVAETAGQVEVCVILTRPETDIFDSVVGVEVFEDNEIKTNEYFPSGAAIADGDPPDTDYEKQEFGLNAIRNEQITELHRRICYNQTVYDDLRLETTEYAGLTLEVQDLVSHGGPTTAETNVDIEHTAIRIIDDDVARVGFEETFYQVDESVGAVELCAVVVEPNIDCPIEFDFNITFETSDISAESPVDYVGTATFLMFESCETRKCMSVTIVNDLIAEGVELFRASLGRTANLDSRITISPDTARVEMTGGVTVTFEKSEYTISEDDGSLQACVLVSEGFSQPLLLTLYTVQDTATASRDYQHKETDMEIHSSSELKQCINVTIVNNILPDGLRQFQLRVSSSSHSVSTIPVVVTILDDEIGRGCTLEVLNSSVSEEEDRIEVVEEISEVLTSIGIPIAIPNITILLNPLAGLGGGRRGGGGEGGNGTGEGGSEREDEMPVEQPPLKVVYEVIAEEFEVEASEEGYSHFVEAVNQVTEAKETACEGEGSVSSADVPELVREYRTLRENVSQNIVQLREVFGKMLCISETDSGDRRKKRDGHCPEVCECPPGGLFDENILCVCEFFACMDPERDLKPILGLFDVIVEEGFPCLALVVDTTGSMSNEIAAAKHVIHNFLSSEEHEPGCYVLLPFNDLSNDEFIPESIGEPTIASTYNEGASVEELRNFITATDAMIADGGLDCPERQLHALLKTLSVRDSEGYEVMIPGSHIVMLTDAPSHDLELETQVISRANDQKVCISFFLSMRGGCIHSEGQMMYERISNATGGTVTESIDQDGFRYFDSTHGSTQCADFYGLEVFGERRKRQAPEPTSHDAYGTEMRCHSFTTSLLTTNVKVSVHTSQPAVRVTKPTGESVSVPTLYGSSGPVFGESSPPSGLWSVCVDTGTLTITLEKNDVMDNILRYLRPVVNSTQFLTTSSPPSACTTGRISIKTSRIADIASADIQLLSEESGDILVTAPLYGCSDLLLGNITFPSATVKYRIVGNDTSGYPFTISLSNSATFEAGDFRVETEGENPVEIDPRQSVAIPVTVHNLNREYVQYVFTAERVTGFLRAFRPSNQLVVAPGASGSVNLIASATTAAPGSSHMFTATVTDGCTNRSISKTVIIRLPAATSPPPADECGCQNGGTCNIRVIRGRVIRRCLCPAGFGGTRCTIPVTA